MGEKMVNCKAVIIGVEGGGGVWMNSVGDYSVCSKKVRVSKESVRKTKLSKLHLVVIVMKHRASLGIAKSLEPRARIQGTERSIIPWS